jgi:hypothetical protein
MTVPADSPLAYKNAHLFPVPYAVGLGRRLGEGAKR